MIARRLRFPLLMLLALPLALLACGGDDHKEAHSADTTATPPFPQTFESQTGLKVYFPDGWLVQDGEQGVYLANNDLVMTTVRDADGAEMPEKGVAVIVLTPLTEAGYPGLVDLQPPALVEEIAATLPQALGGGAAEIGQAEDAKVGDYPAARVSVSQPDQLIEGYLIGFKPQPDVAILALVRARKGALGEEESTITKILENVTYHPPQPAADETPTPPSVVAPPTTTPDGSATQPPDAAPTAEGGA